MRKLILFIVLVCCLPMLAGIHSYTSTSVLSDGSWVKIRVSESGVCRMSFSEIESAGLNPQQLRVFGYGGAQKEQDFSKRNIDDLPQVPVYVGDNYVLFYVQGPISWTYNSSAGRFTHTRNTYSDYGYYFLTDNVGSLLTPTEGAAVSGSAKDVTSYMHYQVQDKDSINLIDRTGVSGGGRTFYGEQFIANQKRTFTFATPNAIEGESNKVYIDVAANAPTISSFIATVNESATKAVTVNAIPDHYTFGCVNTISMNAIVAADKQKVQLQLTNTNAGALGWLNYIEITTPSALRMTGSFMPIRTTEGLSSSSPIRFRLSNAVSTMQVWDVTRLDAIERMPAQFANGELTWVASQADGIHEFVAVNTAGSQWVKAEVIGNVSHQNLHALNDIDYVIICPEGYEEVSADLARAHQTKEAITWAVVTDQQVYNEFSSGTPDASAYRWLMKMLYDRANSGIGQ